ncbi:glycosyl transferase, partial [bacterium]|nr:glycosyl transferase [bacterium]
KRVNVDVLMSGKMQHFDFGQPIKYNFKGFTFVYERGAVNWFKTVLNTDLFRFIYDVLSIDLSDYDLVISDFEPVSAWGALLKGKRCINMSHQASFKSFKTPRPKSWPLFLVAEAFLRLFSYSREYMGFHFKSYDTFIFPPVINDEIINAVPTIDSHITVYLSSFFLERQIEFFKQFPEYVFHVFHSDCKEKEGIGNVVIAPLSDSFKYSLISSSGCITNAGFELNAEALYLQKPLLSIPIRYQYEQYCNAAALKKLGVTISKKLDYLTVKYWLEKKPVLEKLSVSSTSQIVDSIVSRI